MEDELWKLVLAYREEKDLDTQVEIKKAFEQCLLQIKIGLANECMPSLNLELDGGVKTAYSEAKKKFF